MENYTGFVYIWYDKKRKMFYIGSHMGLLDDGYIGSNTRLQRAYKKRPDDFKRKILKFFFGDDKKELLMIEQSFLDKIKYEELCLYENEKNGTIRYYNIKPIASGLSGRIASDLRKKWWDSDDSNEWRKKLSEKMKVKNPSQIAANSENGWVPWNKGKKCPQISIAKKGKPSTISTEKHSEIAKKKWADGCFDNRPPLSDETKQKISKSHKALNRKQTEYQKAKAREANLGKPKGAEQKRKLSEIAKENSKILVTCPHCGYIGCGPVMKRWHMTNCKSINKLIR